MRGAWVLGLLLLSLHTPREALPAAPEIPIADSDSSVMKVTGVYQWAENPREEIWVASLGKGILQVRCGTACHAVGFWDGSRFCGVVRPSSEIKGGEPSAQSYGQMEFVQLHADTLRAELALSRTGAKRTVVWTRRPVAPGLPEYSTPPSDPQPGDYVHVDELPEAITRVPPSYPEQARRKRIQGTVMVLALVGRDGRVMDTRIQKGVPGLDEAAMAAVKQWIFKPAKSGGLPKSVWIVTPVKFSLH